MKGGALNDDGIAKFLFPFDDNGASKANQIIQECVGVNDSDRCEDGSKKMSCIQDTAKKHGFTA